MRRVGQRDSEAEVVLRSALHRRGLRFRVNRKTEGIKVDIVFVSARVAVFVDGCFWHGCPEHATYPRSNQDYWLPKLAENKERDVRQTAKLRAAGWKVIRVWEHDCLPPPENFFAGSKVRANAGALANDGYTLTKHGNRTPGIRSTRRSPSSTMGGCRYRFVESERRSIAASGDSFLRRRGCLG